MKRVGLFADPRVAALAPFASVRAALVEAGLDVALYDAVAIEPTDASFLDAARFAREAKLDGYVSVGGGSVIDTCKAANLYASHPAEHLAYVNAPVGEGRAVPGPLAPHVLQKAWDKARTKLDLGDLHLHDLRHLAGTLAASTGASTKEVMHRLGHASPQAALRYQHATRDRDVAIARALDGLIQRGA